MAPLAIPHTHNTLTLKTTCDESFGCFPDGCTSDSTTTKTHEPLCTNVEATLQFPAENKRRIRFSNTILVKTIPARSELTEDDIISTWWTQNDYFLIKKMCVLTVRMLSSGATIDDNDEDFCTRGLEFRSKAGSVKHYRRKKLAQRAVLSAQDFQRREQFFDPDYISELSSEYTKTSKAEALERALRDQLRVYENCK